MSEQLFHVGVKALCKNEDGQYLVLEVNPEHFRVKQESHWDIPGGRIEEGESINTTLQREVKEELGIDIAPGASFFTAVVSNIKLPHGDRDEVGLAVMIYTVTLPRDAAIVLSEENLRHEWVSAGEAAKRLAFKYPKEFTERLVSND